MAEQHYEEGEVEFRAIVRQDTFKEAVSDEQAINELLHTLAPPPAYTPTVDAASVKNTVIPQTGGKFDDPFGRAYTPQLEAYGISEKDWLVFQDALNIALIGSPPLRIVDMVGTVIGFVPHEWAMIAGIVINVTAQTAVHIISKTLSERLLRKFNASYFAPRGLVVRIMAAEAMKCFVGATAEKEKDHGFKHGLNKFGNGVGDALLFSPIKLPFTTKIIKSIRGAPSPDEASGNTILDRRLAPLLPYISPLNFDVPPLAKTEGPIDKMSSWALKLREWQQRSEERKAANLREGVASGHPMKKMLITRRVKPMKMKKARRRLDTANMKEERRSIRSLWLVVLTLEQDQAIKDRKLEDDPALDIEEIPEAEWEAEMKAEDERHGGLEQYELDGEEMSEAGSSKH